MRRASKAPRTSRRGHPLSGVRRRLRPPFEAGATNVRLSVSVVQRMRPLRYGASDHLVGQWSKLNGPGPWGPINHETLRGEAPLFHARTRRPAPCALRLMSTKIETFHSAAVADLWLSWISGAACRRSGLFVRPVVMSQALTNNRTVFRGLNGVDVNDLCRPIQAILFKNNVASLQTLKQLAGNPRHQKSSHEKGGPHPRPYGSPIWTNLFISDFAAQILGAGDPW